MTTTPKCKAYPRHPLGLIIPLTGRQGNYFYNSKTKRKTKTFLVLIIFCSNK